MDNPLFADVIEAVCNPQLVEQAKSVIVQMKWLATSKHKKQNTTRNDSQKVLHKSNL